MGTTVHRALLALLAALSSGARADGLPQSIATQLPSGYQPFVAQGTPTINGLSITALQVRDDQ